MGIGERLRKTAPVETVSRQSYLADDTTPRYEDPLGIIERKAGEALFARLGQRLFDPNLSESQLQSYVVQELDSVLEGELKQLSAEERHEIVQAIGADILGLGPIEQFMADPEITEVMVNSNDSIYIERNGRLYLTESRFVAVEHLRQVIERNRRRYWPTHRRVVSYGRCPAPRRLPCQHDHSAAGGRWPRLDHPQVQQEFVRAEDLTRIGSLNEQAAAFLDACVRGEAEHFDFRRHGFRQDNDAQRRLFLHSRRRTDCHDRGRSRTSAPSATRHSSREPSGQRGRQGAGSDSRSWSGTPFVCDPIASSSARYVAQKPSTCFRP